MKDKLQRLWVRFTNGLPEVLLGIFLLALVPAVILSLVDMAGSVAGLFAESGRMLDSAANDVWKVLGVLACVAGLAFLTVRIVVHWTVVWAVARKMIVEALNRKVVVVLLIFFLVLAPLLPFLLESEGGAVKSKVQMVLLYSMTMALILMSLVGIFVATSSVSSEVELKQVHITDTKPLSRWEFLLGKWFGVVVLCGVVLFAMGAMGYTLVRYTHETAKRGILTGSRSERDEILETIAQNEALAEEMRDRQEEVVYDAVREEVFTARRAVPAQFDPYFMKDEQNYVDYAVAQWRKGMVGEKRAAQFSRIEGARREYQTILNTASYDRPYITWEFSGLDPAKEVTIRFQAFMTGSNRFFGQFRVCDKIEQEVDKEEEAGGENIASTGPKPPRYANVLDARGNFLRVWPNSDRSDRYADGWPCRSAVEVKLPAGAVRPDGRLFLRYVWTVQPSGKASSVTFDPTEKVTALQQQGTFMGNYYRSILIILCQVALLAAFGILAGSLFSFPVAALVVVFLFVGGMVSPWFYDKVLTPDTYEKVTMQEAQMREVLRTIGKVLIFPLPNFGNFSPMDDLANGRTVAWSQVGMAGGLLVVLKGGVALALAAFFYTRRELARVIL